MMTRYSFRISGWVDVDDAKMPPSHVATAINWSIEAGLTMTIPQAKEFRIDKCEVVRG